MTTYWPEPVGSKLLVKCFFRELEEGPLILSILDLHPMVQSNAGLGVSTSTADMSASDTGIKCFNQEEDIQISNIWNNLNYNFLACFQDYVHCTPSLK